MGTGSRQENALEQKLESVRVPSKLKWLIAQKGTLFYVFLPRDAGWFRDSPGMGTALKSRRTQTFCVVNYSSTICLIPSALSVGGYVRIDLW